MSPELPADLFTSCLTTPVQMALRWFVLQGGSRLVPNVTLELLERVPGQLHDRRTMLGELNWIFTAITDTIAWNVLPKALFQKLFRQVGRWRPPLSKQQVATTLAVSVPLSACRPEKCPA